MYDLKPTTIFCDNKSTIDFSKNLKFSRALKHIDVKFHFIKQYIDLQLINLQHMSTKIMPADILTKGIGKIKLSEFLLKMGLTKLSDKEVISEVFCEKSLEKSLKDKTKYKNCELFFSCLNVYFLFFCV